MALTADEVIIQQTNTYPRERDRRHYRYQSSFGNHPPIFYDLKNLPWLIGQSNDIYWSKHRRVNRDYTYPSFFMNIKTIPTYGWSCETLSEGDVWTCETLDETLSDNTDESGGTDGWGSGWGN